MDCRIISILLVISTSTVCLILGSTGSPPKFKQHPIHDVTAVNGESHKFQCKVTGRPKPVLVWYNGNEIISENKRFKIRKYSMEISNLKKWDSGNYACRASNDHGEIWGNFSLQVVDDKGPPVFKKRLNKVRFIERALNGIADFDCEVKANPAASIVWLKNEEELEAYPGKYILDGFKLTVKSLQLEDKGDYTCVVRNEYGSVNWTIALEVQQRVAIAPILEDIKNQTARVGDNVKFICHILLSDSQPLLQWLRHYKTNGSYVNEKGEPYVKIIQSYGFKNNNDECSLVLPNVTKEDEGFYTCLVANTVGINYRSAWLSVVSDLEVDSGGCHVNALLEDDGEMITCTCKPGYTGDGYTCINIDECSEAGHPCLRGYTCEDKSPGYICLPVFKP